MADLAELDRAEAVKVAGAAPSTGITTNYMQVDVNGSAQVGLYNSLGASIDFNYGLVGTGTIRAAAQIGNATGAADFNAGATGAQTLRVVANQGAPSAANTTPWYVRLSDGTDSSQITANGDLQAVDIANNGGVSGVIAVGNTPVAIRVGASNLANRKRLSFINVGNVTMYWSYSSTLTGAGDSAPIFRNQPVSDSWGPGTTMWVISPIGAGSLWVGEGA